MCTFAKKYDIFFMKINRIKEILDEKGISQTWLAKKKLNKSFNTVNSYVCNRSQPTLETLLTIAKILNVDVRLLIENNEDEQLDK